VTQFVRRLWQLLRPHRGATLLAIAFMAVAAGSTAGIAWLAGPAADQLFGADVAHPDLTVRVLWVIGLSLLVLRGFASWAQGWMVALIQQSVAFRLRADATARLVRLETARLDQRAGQIASRISADVDRIEGMVNIGLAPLLSGLLVVGALLVVAFEHGSALPLVMLLSLPLIALATSVLSRPIRHRYKKAAATRGRLSAAIVETVGRLEILRAFQAAGWRRAHLDAVARDVRDDTLHAQRTSILVAPLVGTVTAAVLAIVVYWAHTLVESGEMKIATFSTLTTVAVLIYRPVQMIGRGFSQAASTMGALDHYDEFMALSVAPARGPAAPGERISREGVSVVLGGRPILSELDLELSPNRSIAFVGPNGAGKTSLLRVLIGALPLAGGVVKVDGEPDPDRVRVQDMISWVPQEPLLFTGTVASNVTLNDEVDETRLAAALRWSGAASWASAETWLDDAGRSCSRGERQMLSIARALYSRAPYLLLDEPAASLDQRTAASLVQTLDTLRDKRALIVVTHQKDISSLMDDTYEVRNGRVVLQQNDTTPLAESG